MNEQEVATFYAQCMAVRPWLKPLGPNELKGWWFILADVPAEESLHIIREIFGDSPRAETDEYKFFEARTVLNAWKTIQLERKKIVDRVHSVDRYLLIEDFEQVVREKLAERERLLSLLPSHVVEREGIGQRQLSPPPKYPRGDSGEVVPHGLGELFKPKF